jgi:hypothetical protein
MVNGIGADLTNDEKRAHLIDLKRELLFAELLRGASLLASTQIVTWEQS